MKSVIFGNNKGVLVQTDQTTERFFMAEFNYFEPITGIDAEIEACNVVCDIRTAHREIGIEKECKAYDYMKLAIMEKLEKGIRMTDKHDFKDNGEVIKIHLN